MESAAGHIAVLTPDDLETPPISLRQLTWRRFRRHKLAFFGAVVLNDACSFTPLAARSLFQRTTPISMTQPSA